MRKAALLCLALLALRAFAQVPVEQLAVPPPQAEHFLIVSSAGRHGSVKLWRAADGTLMSRMSINLRGQFWETDEAARVAADGTVTDYHLRGSSPSGDVDETFSVVDGTARWKSPQDAGSAPQGKPAHYLPIGWSMWPDRLLYERLIASGQSLPLLPGGAGRAEALTRLNIAGADGSSRELQAWAVVGIAGTPYAIWADADGRYVASIGAVSTVRADLETAAPVLREAQDLALSRRAAMLARELTTRPAGPVVFRDVRAFVDGRRFAEHRTVVVEAGRITAVGIAGKLREPPGATVIDGRGKTLLPGLWDSHQHVGDDYSGLLLLSLGITSLRDPGNVDALTQARRQRREAGELLLPHVHASSMIDGKGPNTAQVANVVTSLEEALQAVDNAKARGMSAIKLYGSLDPAWVAPMAARARALGLHVHGHLPAGMRPAEAIAAGYREITHINFVAMQAMPDDVVTRSNTILRWQGIGEHARRLKLDAEPMASLIRTMAARRIAVDPTLSFFEQTLTMDNGQLNPAYAPFAGSLPPAVERSLRQGGLAPPAGQTREGFRASFVRLQALVRRLQQAGVPIVAGTDGSGMELVRELELYVQAGLTPAQALATATVQPATLQHVQARTGSIAAGLDADLLLVDGDPSRRIGDLRRTRLVMMDGLLLDADRLRAASGINGRPAWAAEME